MAQFDVHRLVKASALVIDCQSDLLADLDTRFVVPLAPRTESSPPAQRLNPIFTVDGVEHVMLTQAAATLRRRDLGPVVVSLADRDREIMNALDFLLTGI